MAEAIRADMPIPKRIDKAHFRVLLAFSLQTGGKGRRITIKSTKMLKEVSLIAENGKLGTDDAGYAAVLTRRIRNSTTYLKGVNER